MMSTRQSLGGLNKSAFWDVWHGTSLFKQRIAYPFGAIATSAFCGRKSVMRRPFSSPTLALLQPALCAWKHIHRVAMPSVDEDSALVGLEMGKSLGTGIYLDWWQCLVNHWGTNAIVSCLDLFWMNSLLRMVNGTNHWTCQTIGMQRELLTKARFLLRLGRLVMFTFECGLTCCVPVNLPDRLMSFSSLM